MECVRLPSGIRVPVEPELYHYIIMDTPDCSLAQLTARVTEDSLASLMLYGAVPAVRVVHTLLNLASSQRSNSA